MLPKKVESLVQVLMLRPPADPPDPPLQSGQDIWTSFFQPKLLLWREEISLVWERWRAVFCRVGDMLSVWRDTAWSTAFLGASLGVRPLRTIMLRRFVAQTRRQGVIILCTMLLHLLDPRLEQLHHCVTDISIIYLVNMTCNLNIFQSSQLIVTIHLACT